MICDFSYCFPEQTDCYSSDSTDGSKPMLIIGLAAHCRAARHPGLGCCGLFLQLFDVLSGKLFSEPQTVSQSCHNLCVCVCVRTCIQTHVSVSLSCK